MIITVDDIQQLKKIPNSGYENIKVEFLFHSNKLEGSTFTKENLETYLSKQIIEGSHKVDDVYETINSTELFDFVIDTLGEPLSERLIIEFHQMLKKNTLDQERGFAGCWKKIPNLILGAGEKLQVAQPYEVPERINRLIKAWYESEKDFESIIKCHADFEKIHPFQDGNGRIGRFIILKQCLENEVELISIDEQYSVEYKSALYKAQTENDYSKLNSVMQSCQKLLNKKLGFLETTLEYLRSQPNDISLDI